MSGCAGATEVVELDIEPVVCALVLLVVLGAYLLAPETLFESLCLRGRAVLVRAAQEQRVAAVHTTVLGKYVGAEAAADYVAQMRNVIHVGKCRRDQYVRLVFDRQANSVVIIISNTKYTLLEQFTVGCDSTFKCTQIITLDVGQYWFEGK